MPIKVLQFALIQGMNQDISPSKRTDKFAYEIKNMRVTIEDDNTLLAWTSEKGTELIVTQLPNGKVLGSCVINDELILFVKDSTSDTPDCICGIINIDTEPEVIYYYKGNLNFQELNKIETIGVIENSKLHKVYWIDGYNQPRFINIADKTKRYSSDSTQFDFLPTDNTFKQTVNIDDDNSITIERTLKVEIEKVYQVGLFKAGTIQYAFNYYNLNGALTNLVYISPIHYISSLNKGNNVDETVNCAFKIKCSYVNKDFDYLRIYSISRTSTDTTPLVRIVTDIPTKNAVTEEVYIDLESNNSNGRRAPLQYTTNYELRYGTNDSLKDSFQIKQMESSIVGNIYREPINDATNANDGTYDFRTFTLLDNLRDFITGKDNTLYELNKEDYLVWDNYVYYTYNNCMLRITKVEEPTYPGYYTYTISSFVESGGTSPEGGVPRVHRRNFISVNENSNHPLTEVKYGILEAPVIEFTDNGTVGSIFEYNALLFMNNSAIIPNTMDLKDNTLFIGNYKYKENNDFELKRAIEDSGIKANDLIKFVNVLLTNDFANQYYPYTNQNKFSADKIMGFKGGEEYIFGFMVLNLLDKWSSIIAFKDAVVNNVYPKVEETDLYLINKNEDKKYSTYIVLAMLNDTIGEDEEISPYRRLIDTIKSTGQYKAIKFVIVSKNTAQRNIVCQGVLCPTVFCQENRIKHQLPFAQSSWFFRPIMRHNPSYYETSDSSAVPEFRHYNLIGGEIQSSSEILSEKELNDTYNGHVPNYFEYTAGYTRPISYDRVTKDVEENSDYYGNTRFGVDNLILTMHSPDIEFDSTVQSILDDNDILKFRIIGYTKVHSTYSDADISLKRKSFFYERVIEGNSKAMTGRIITGQDKLINIYDLKYPAAGLSSYNGLIGDTYYNYSYTKEEGELINPYTDKGELNNTYYKIYPWHRSTSLNALPTPSVQVKEESGESTLMDDSYWLIPLEHKEISNVRVCCKTKLGQDYVWRPLTLIEESSDKRGIGNIYVWYPTDKVTKIKDATFPWDNQITYEGNIDTVLNVSPKRCYWLEYTTKRGGGRVMTSMNGHLRSNDLIRMKYKSSAHAVFNLSFNRYKSENGDDYYQLWILPGIKDNDVTINTQWAGYQTVSWDIQGKEGTNVKTFNFKNINCYNASEDNSFKLLFMPRGSNEGDRNNIYDYSSDKLGEIANYCKNKISNFIYENSEGEYYILVIYGKYQRDTSGDGYKRYSSVVIHYIPYNRDTRQSEEYKVENYILYVGECFKDNSKGYIVEYVNSSTGVITLKEIDITEDLLTDEAGITVGNNLYTIKDYKIDPEDDGIFYIGELYLDSKLSTAERELENYNWQAASDAISLYENNIPNLYGDTYFQRYDCLKTYSAGPDDPNQIVDIGSFMLETRINMDGRYDRNRGLLSNLNITDTNFNLINKAYTQNDYFVNTYINNSNLDVSEYPNTITWSLTKVYGEPIDNWTHLTNTSNLDLDGERGTLTKIVNFQDVLLFFLTEGAGIIKYNENVALAATNELPVELANSGKVDGKLYLNRIIGCQNKDTIVVTKNALYFIDGNTNSIYLMTLAQSLANPESITENSFENFMKAQDISTAKGFYNKDKQEVYYIFDNEEAPCIAYSENTKQFTSFYDYKPSFFECIGETAYHILNSELNTFSIWALNRGDYNHFYGTYKPFYITVSANGEDGIVDKIWNNVEFRADTYNDNELLSNITFDELNVWNEHQVGTAKLTLYGNNGSINSPSNLKKKFRIWRTNIPRSQYVACPKFNKGINVTIENSIFKNLVDLGRGRNRIRNPWTYIQLKNSNPDAYKTILHDLVVYYFE